MLVVESIDDLRGHLDAVRAAGATVGFAPTMGALHEGHLSLASTAAEQCDVVVMSIFVNPTQFGADEDFSAYPRPIEHDLELAQDAGVDVVFLPSVDAMYPPDAATTVHVRGLTEHFEGASRPGHFDGVATVVAKLFAIVGECRAYFGEKDFQQLAVIRRMAADLDLPVEVIGCPIVRESDGLAMSSRNVYLTPPEREAATVLHRSLRAARALIDAGERDRAVVEAHIASIIDAEPLAELDYVAIVDPLTLVQPEILVAGSSVRILLVAQVGIPRLLDNLGIDVA